MRAYLSYSRQSMLALTHMICSFEEILYRLVIVPLVAFLPAPLAYDVACLRGSWRYWLDIPTRKRVMRNLEGALGEQVSLSERTRVTRDFFRWHACEAIDVMRLAGKGRMLAQLVEIRGLEHIEAALAGGKGAMICSAHYGSFNSCFSLIAARGFPVTAVGDWRSNYAKMTGVKRLLWRLMMERPIAHHRHRPNIEPEKEVFGTAMLMLEILRSNELIAMAIEDPVAPENRTRAVEVDFLGRKVRLLPGSTDVAQFTGSPVLLMVARRLPDWRHQVLEISSPVPLEGDAIKDFKLCMKLLEEPIRQNPAYWAWWANTEALIDVGLLPAEKQLVEI